MIPFSFSKPEGAPTIALLFHRIQLSRILIKNVYSSDCIRRYTQSFVFPHLLSRLIIHHTIIIEGNRKKTNNRRRRPTGAKKEGEVVGLEGDEPAKERVQQPFLPSELLGKVCIGTIAMYKVRGDDNSYGFIDLVPSGTKAIDTTPKIYFNTSEYTSKDFLPRRGLEVQFQSSKDDKDRIFATKVNLTSAGIALAEEKKKAAAERAAASPPAEGENKGSSKPRAKKPKKRSPDDDRVVKLIVTCEGKGGEKEVEAKIGQSLGALKYNSCNAFEADPTMTMFVNGESLNRSILKTLKDGDKINLKST